MDRKIPFYFLESESFHNDDTYDTLNEPKHENATEVTFLSLTGKKTKQNKTDFGTTKLSLSAFIWFYFSSCSTSVRGSGEGC